jgi:formylmethanofuran dehydrogenase subunit E-like metal-binding protein
MEPGDCVASLNKITPRNVLHLLPQGARRRRKKETEEEKGNYDEQEGGLHILSGKHVVSPLWKIFVIETYCCGHETKCQRRDKAKRRLDNENSQCV